MTLQKSRRRGYQGIKRQFLSSKLQPAKGNFFSILMDINEDETKENNTIKLKEAVFNNKDPLVTEHIDRASVFGDKTIVAWVDGLAFQNKGLCGAGVYLEFGSGNNSLS